MSEDDAIKSWIKDHGIEDVEAFVPDMAGTARGKMIPAKKFGTGELKLPAGIFAQTISGEYVIDPRNLEDRDMLLIPDASSMRPVPWLPDGSASIFLDCVNNDGEPIGSSPRCVLQKVLAMFDAKEWTPVVAPEVEFYLVSSHTDPCKEIEPPKGRLGRTETGRQPYSLDAMNDFDPFIVRIYEYCEAQGIQVDTLSQEMGPAQLEINFKHGNAVDLADHVLLFKRSVKEAAIEHELHATFLARPMSDKAGSALHIHQSILDHDGNNIFSNSDGSPTDLFDHYIGGLQKYMPDAMLLFAPYANSYRRLLNYVSSPINLEWAIDNRTVGLRVPESAPEARRVENRLAGADVNPYLVLAATLACGYLGMTEGIKARAPIVGTAYDLPFGLHYDIHAAIGAFSNSQAMRNMFGEEFVDLYCIVKEDECNVFDQIVTPWEREILMLQV